MGGMRWLAKKRMTGGPARDELPLRTPLRKPTGRKARRSCLTGWVNPGDNTDQQTEGVGVEDDEEVGTNGRAGDGTEHERPDAHGLHLMARVDEQRDAGGDTVDEDHGHDDLGIDEGADGGDGDEGEAEAGEAAQEACEQHGEPANDEQRWVKFHGHLGSSSRDSSF